MKSPISMKNPVLDIFANLAYIYNTPISQGKFPDRLKH
jgi:hypothetical protein